MQHCFIEYFIMKFKFIRQKETQSVFFLDKKKGDLDFP